MSYSYVLVDKKTNQIKVDSKTGMLCIFDTQNEAEKVKNTYISKTAVSLIKCVISFSNKVEL